MLAYSDVSPWLAVFGRFHIVLLHLPIGLIPGMFLLEFGAAVLRKPPLRGVQLALGAMAAVTAGLALASGLVLAGEHEHRLLGQHKWFAIGMTAMCVLLPFLALKQKRMAFRIVLLAAVGLSVPTGHLGGSMTHRSDFLFKPLERAEEQKNGTEPEGDEPNPNGGKPETPPAAKTRFEREIQPILERVCTSCHNPEGPADDPEGPDGDLILTTRDGILCTDREEEDRVIVPGDPDASLLIELCELPVDDDDRMPPAKEEQITAAEVKILRAWIKDGAKFD